MLKNNAVVFKGKKDGITVLLDEKAEYQYLREVLGKKVIDARKFFNGGKTAIKFQGRQLSDEEESDLLDIIRRGADLDISYFSNESSRDGDSASNNSVALSPVTKENTSKPFIQEQSTAFRVQSLRSGQSVRYSGSVVVLGDVNPGAEVIAEGSIIILGAAKGFLHAGCAGDTSCFISANRLKPTQLRIADIITYIPAEKKTKKKEKGAIQPEALYAYIQDGQIYIAPLLD